MIKLGDTNINKIFFGDTSISSVYRNEEKLFGSGGSDAPEDYDFYFELANDGVDAHHPITFHKSSVQTAYYWDADFIGDSKWVEFDENNYVEMNRIEPNKDKLYVKMELYASGNQSSSDFCYFTDNYGMIYRTTGLLNIVGTLPDCTIDYQYCKLFGGSGQSNNWLRYHLYDCSGFTIPNVLTGSCFKETFAQTESMISAPTFTDSIVTAYACFEYMFYKSHLKEIQDLHFDTVTDACCRNMFYQSLIKKVRLTTKDGEFYAFGGAFSRCFYNSKLEEIEINFYMNSGCSDMLASCYSLTKVITTNNKVISEKSVFKSITSTGTLYINQGLNKDDYVSYIPSTWTIEYIQ